MHDRVDNGETSYRTGVRVTRSTALRSALLGISGVADVVEWHKQNSHEEPFPVEYKRGKPKKHDADKFSFVLRRCALRRCLKLKFWQAHCSTVRQSIGLMLISMMLYEKKLFLLQKGCTIFFAME